MKNFEKRDGFKNRHTYVLPIVRTTIIIITQDIDNEHIHRCEWQPFKKGKYSKENMPSEGYLGSARVIEGRYKGISFHAWEQNNSEFVWYSLCII